MRIWLILLMVMCVTGCSRRSAHVEPAAANFGAADALIEDAIDAGKIPGAVLLVGKRGEVVYRKAYGMRATAPVAQVMTAETVFDLASLTKPVATATSVMILVDRGLIDLKAPAAKYLPGFATNGKGAITVEHLLLHQSGLTPDNHLRDYADGAAVAFEKINALELRWGIGEGFHYSDVGYIVLGKIVEVVSGEPLEVFAKRHAFDVLGMENTQFNPPSEWMERISPTAFEDGKWLRGRVHDPRAAAMDGVAGHAGLFSNVDDLGKYCDMMLGVKGEVMSAQSLKEMRHVRNLLRTEENGEIHIESRNLGFDVSTRYSSARGEVFESGSTFGHTGFTGPAFWMDPVNGTFYVFLCSRLHTEDAGSVVDLRRQIATAVATALRTANRNIK